MKCRFTEADIADVAEAPVSSVGAVYDRPVSVVVTEKRALIERPYQSAPKGFWQASSRGDACGF